MTFPNMKTGFVGIGSMGGMLVRALLRSRALAVENVSVANRSAGKLKALAAEFPGIHVGSSRQLAAQCDLIFLCLKPGDASSVLAQMDGELYPGQLLVTTASQIPFQLIENRVSCRVAKLIPSIVQDIGAGVALLMYGSAPSQMTASCSKICCDTSAIPSSSQSPSLGPRSA